MARLAAELADARNEASQLLVAHARLQSENEILSDDLAFHIQQLDQLGVSRRKSVATAAGREPDAPSIAVSVGCDAMPIAADDPWRERAEHAEGVVDAQRRQIGALALDPGPVVASRRGLALR